MNITNGCLAIKLAAEGGCVKYLIRLVVPHFAVPPPFRAALAGLKPGATKLEGVTAMRPGFLTGPEKKSKIELVLV
jgi:hypothetical protein